MLFVQFTCLVAIGCLATLASSQGKRCKAYEIIRDVKSNELTINENFVPDAIFQILVAGEVCVVNVTEIYDMMSVYKIKIASTRNYVFLRLAMGCIEATEIQFETTGIDSTARKEYLIEIVIDPCAISFETLLSLSRVGKVISLKTNFHIPFTSLSNCNFSEDLQTLTFTNNRCPPNQQCKPFIEICKNTFPSVYSFSMINQLTLEFQISSEFVTELENLFPNLQELDLTNVLLATKLRFPWAQTFVNIPYKDRRSIFFLENKTEHQCCARSFSLQSDFNSTRFNNKESIELDGHISVVKISGVYIGEFKENFFHNVYGLKSLDLSNNNITSVRFSLFKYQRDLGVLILKENSISTIDPDIFKDLQALKYLDMSKNRLTSLKPDVFKSLSVLEEVHLEHNYLYKLPEKIFEHQVMSLIAVYLHSNPLSIIPVFPIYAPTLTVLDLHNTNINGTSFINFLHEIDIPDLISSAFLKFVNRASLVKDPVFFAQLPAKTIDLSFCQIQAIPIPLEPIPLEVEAYCVCHIFLALFHSFQFNFIGNPIQCACDIANLQTLISSVASTCITNFTTNSLICQDPPQLKERKLLSIRDEEMYCPIELSQCPDRCTCSDRLNHKSIIIDCSNTNISNWPNVLPEYKLELLFRNTSIDNIVSRPYFSNVTVMDLRNSRVRFIDPVIFNQLQRLQTFYLDSNLLTTFPVEIKQVNITMMTLHNNPLVCDCRLLWMKHWLLERDSPVQDWKSIKCSDSLLKGTEVINVKDDQFTCSDENSFSTAQHVVFPSVVIGSVLFVFMSISLLVFFQRNSIKVLLYMYCGFHPFDNDKQTHTRYLYDAIAIYSFNDKEFMQESVVDYLKDNGFRVADMYKDFHVGVSFTANVTNFIMNSRRIIMCLSTDAINDNLMDFAWNSAYERSLESTVNYIILILDNCDTKTVTNKTLVRFLKHRRYIKKTSSLLRKELRYLMPKPDDRAATAASLGQLENDTLQSGIFISYPDNLHEYMRQELFPELKEHGYDLRIFEYEFLPGSSKGDEIINIIERSTRLLFILSNETLQDEEKMTILNIAIARHATCDYNFLLVFTKGTILVDEMSSEIRNYVNTYVTSNMDEPDFLQRLLFALPVKKTEVTHDPNDDIHPGLEDGTSIPLV